MQEYQEDNLGESEILDDSDSDANTPRFRSAPAPLSHLRQGYGGQARGEFSPLSKGHKFAVAGLAFFSVFIIFMWFAQFKKSINQPFNYSSKSSVNNNQANTCSGPECDIDPDLKIKDSDSDGITDYDELYVYNTSPYLEDSDSDGFSDKSEIDSDNDPNCPTGKECNSSLVVPDIPVSTFNNNGGVENVLSGESDVSTIRAMLIESGMDKNILDQISDDDLIKSYNEAFDANNDSSTNTGINNGTENAENVLSGESDASTIRAMLIESGMDKNILDQISDEDLMKSYEETLGG